MTQLLYQSKQSILKAAAAAVLSYPEPEVSSVDKKTPSPFTPFLYEVWHVLSIFWSLLFAVRIIVFWTWSLPLTLWMCLRATWKGQNNWTGCFVLCLQINRQIGFSFTSFLLEVIISFVHWLTDYGYNVFCLVACLTLPCSVTHRLHACWLTSLLCYSLTGCLGYFTFSWLTDYLIPGLTILLTGWEWHRPHHPPGLGLLWFRRSCDEGEENPDVKNHRIKN